MGRSVMLSNGEMLVGLNEHGLVHDFYYPYVGLENLTTARSVHHMVGVWVDGHFSWVDDGSWQIEVDFEQDALVSKIVAERADLGVRLRFEDCIDSQYTALLRHITVENLVDRQREIRLFMHQVFQISNDGRADTVLYVPKGNYLFDYKGRCALLISARDQHDQPFDQFSVGNYGIEGKEGTYRDAEDGELSGNLVEHGSVDSVLRCCLTIDARSEGTVNYWIIASYSQYDAEAIHNKLIEQGIERRITATRTWWHQWLATAKPSIDSVFEKYQPIFKKSLLVIKAHIDKRGGTIASCDSSIYNYGRDYYSYVWPRDGGLTMLTLIELGYTAEPKRFFDFCDSSGFRHFRRRINFRNFAVCRRNAVTHAGRGRDQVEIEFAFEAFLNDFHMQKSQKSAAETEAERGRRFRLVEKRSVVQTQFVHRVAQIFVLRRIGRIKSGENHRFDFLKTGKRFSDGSRRFGYRVADLHVGDGFDRSGQKSDFADTEFANRRRARAIYAERFD